MAHGKVGAPRGNTNSKGKHTKDKKSIRVSMGISDHTEISDGVCADLRTRFEDYLLVHGTDDPSEEQIKHLARQWAYAAWWHNLSRDEDERVIIV